MQFTARVKQQTVLTVLYCAMTGTTEIIIQLLCRHLQCLTSQQYDLNLRCMSWTVYESAEKFHEFEEDADGWKHRVHAEALVEVQEKSTVTMGLDYLCSGQCQHRGARQGCGLPPVDSKQDASEQGITLHSG